jgi:hypothetical protein
MRTEDDVSGWEAAVAELRMADRAYVIDNSAERRRLVLVCESGRTRRVSTRLPDWVARALPPDLLDPAAGEVGER